MENDQIVLDDRIYPLTAVEKAISDYSGLGKFLVEHINNKIYITIKNSNVDISRLKGEFCNYLIGILSTKSGDFP